MNFEDYKTAFADDQRKRDQEFLQRRANVLAGALYTAERTRDNWRLISIASWATTIGFIVSMFVF
jgi:hypothetical protein